LAELPAVQQALASAQTQLQSYQAILQEKYAQDLKLRTYAVIAVGFERLYWAEIAT
jgi:hypothetical protein